MTAVDHVFDYNMKIRKRESKKIEATHGCSAIPWRPASPGEQAQP